MAFILHFKRNPKLGSTLVLRIDMKREGIIPPKFADKFFRIDFESDPLPVLCLYPIPPKIELEDLRLDVCGLEQHSRLIPWSSLSSLPRVTIDIPIVCQIFNWFEPVQWEGIRLKDLIDHLRIDTHPEGYFAMYSRDGVYFESLSRDEARDPRVLLAYKLNGKPLPEEHGGPLRLVVPFLQGYKSVKWVSAIRAYRNDPSGIKRLLGQSSSGHLNDTWKERLGIVLPEGKAGDPPPFGDALKADEKEIFPNAKKMERTYMVPPIRTDPEPFPVSNKSAQIHDRNLDEDQISELCEVMAIIRPEHRLDTQKALDEAGIVAYSTYGVLGRGRQKGLKFKGETHSDAAIQFLPRQLFMLVVEKGQLSLLVSTLLKANKTGKKGQFGDGKIFVLALENAVRISTGEVGGEAL